METLSPNRLHTISNNLGNESGLDQSNMNVHNNTDDNVTVMNTLPEEIQVELNRHAEYHLLKSTSNQIQTSLEYTALSTDQGNPILVEGNPALISISGDNEMSITETNISYTNDKADLQQRTNSGAYFGSETSSFNVFNASENLGSISENHVVEEVGLPTELNYFGIDDDYLRGFVEKTTNDKTSVDISPKKYTETKPKANKGTSDVKKASDKSATLLDSTSISKIKRMWAKTCPSPPKGKKIFNKKKQIQGTSETNPIRCMKNLKLAENQVAKKRPRKDKKKKEVTPAYNEQHLLSNYKIAPCSVKLYRLNDINEHVSTQMDTSKTAVVTANSAKEHRNRQIVEMNEQMSNNGKDGLEASYGGFSLDNVKLEEWDEEYNDDQVFNNDQVFNDHIACNDDTAYNDDPAYSDDSFDPEYASENSVSEDEYTPNKNDNLSKVFLKATRIRKTKNDKNKNVPRKIDFESATVVKPKKTVSKSGNNHGPCRIGRPPVIGHFECKKCSFTADEKNLVEKHYRKIHPMIKKTCGFCDRTFKNYTCLLEHEATKHTKMKIFNCHVDGCDYASTNRVDLSRHQSKHLTEKCYSCKLCGWTTKWRRNLRSHHLMKHTSEKKYKCNICNYECKRNTDLKQHMFRHTSAKPIQCMTCGFCVKTNWELKSHMLTHSSEKPFKCKEPECEYASKTNADLLKHMRSVHKELRDFICPICNKGYKNKQSLLKHHGYAHESTRAFKCDICDKAFKIRSALYKHLVTHTDYKPYKCSVCDMRFRNKQGLRTHSVTHDFKSRPYRCPLCPYAAKEEGVLLAHIGSFHGQSYCYFCEICKKPFQRHSKLQMHYQRMHKRELPRLKDGDQIDLALVKIELELLEELNKEKNKKPGKRGRPRKKVDKTTQIHQIAIKEEPIDDGYETVRNTETQKEKEHEGGEDKQRKGTDDTSIDIARAVLEHIIDKVIGQNPDADNVDNIDTIHEAVDTSRDVGPQESCKIPRTGTKDNNEQSVEDVTDDDEIQIVGSNFLENAPCDDDSSQDEQAHNSSGTLEIQEQNTDGVDPDLEEITEALGPGNLSQASFVGTCDWPGDSLMEDGTSSFTETENATVAVYANLRIPLATRGFKFNYDKNGTKPNTWFMDPDLMNEKDASKQKKHMRRKGLLPPLPRGKPPKGPRGPRKKNNLKDFLKKRTEIRNHTILKSKLLKSPNRSAREGLKRKARFEGKYSEIDTELTEENDSSTEDNKIVTAKVEHSKPNEKVINQSDLKAVDTGELKDCKNNIDTHEGTRLTEGKRKRKPTQTFEIIEPKKKSRKNVKSKTQSGTPNAHEREQKHTDVTVNKDSNNSKYGNKSKLAATQFPGRWTKKYIPVRQRKAMAKKEFTSQNDNSLSVSKSKDVKKSIPKPKNPCKDPNEICSDKIIDTSNLQDGNNEIQGQVTAGNCLLNFCDDVVASDKAMLETVLGDNYVKSNSSQSNNKESINSDKPVHPVHLIENQQYLNFEINLTTNGLTDSETEQDLMDSQEFTVSLNVDADYGLSEVKTEPTD